MESTTAGTSDDGPLERRQRFAAASLSSWSWGLLPVLASVGVMAWRIHASPRGPIYDQAGFLEHSLQPLPRFSSGVSTALLGALVRAWSPDALQADHLVRVMALVLFVGSTWLLVSRLVKGAGFQLLLMMLLVGSQYPMLWLSTELFAAAFLALTLWSAASSHPLWVTSMPLALFSLAKPDLLLSGAAVAAVLATSGVSAWRDRLRRATVLLAGIAVLLLPGVAQQGVGYLEGDGRALVSFGQHYAAMVAPHQLQRPPHPWMEWQRYLGRSWTSVGSVSEAIARDPGRYLDFVFLSLAATVRNAWRAGLLLLLPLAFLAWKLERGHPVGRLVLAVTVGLIPITLLSYMHVRYAARFFVCLLALAAIALEHARTRGQPRLQAVCVGLLLAVFAWQVATLQPSVWLNGYWFPD